MSFTLEIKWDDAALARVITRGRQKFIDVPRAAIQRVAPLVKARAIEISPEKSGRFKKSWRYRTSSLGADGAQLSLENTDTKAAAVIFGSRAHTIFPRNGKFLRFESAQGDVIFTKHVNTPAMPGNNVFQNLEEDDIFQEEVSRTFDDFMRELAANL